MSVSVEINIQNLPEFQQDIQKFDEKLQQVRAWLYEWAQKVKTKAEQNAPVRTGYLKSTIYAQVKEWVVEIGAKATYAYFVEFGTRHMRANPFLCPAIQEFLPELEMNLVGAIEQAKREASR